MIFGAGRIGRSFIGQLFGTGGYEVVFIDTDPVIVDLLNKYKSYRVIIKDKKEYEIIVKNVRAISGFDLQQVAETVSSAGILAVSVGKNSVNRVIPEIAEGLKLRFVRNPETPLDIIIAENIRDANHYFRDRLVKYLPAGYPLENLVGLVETSIGKMVPITTAEELERDPLSINAEEYNTLILDGKAFRSGIPDIAGLAPKENIRAWVERKAFIHNLGHATAAYYGFCRHPEAVYMYEVLDDKNVLQFTRGVMHQAAEVLRSAYPDEFTAAELKEHIEDLISRFRNRALHDTLFRVGHDLTRKLAPDDRFLGAIRLALRMGKPYDMILKAMSYGFTFEGKDEDNRIFPADGEFLAAASRDINSTLTINLGMDPQDDKTLIKELKKQILLNQQECK